MHAPVELSDSPVAARGDAQVRYHHLDAVRGFALMLGVVFHAAESFGANNHYWAVVDCSPSGLLEWFRFGCHSFRLELFFLIAGFFARLVILKRGVAGFTRNRARRILVPFVVGWAVLYPIMAYLWIWGWSLSGQLSQMGVPPEFQQLPPWKLWLGFLVTGTFLQKLDMLHLWFLHQLMVIYLLLLGARWVWRRWDDTGANAATCDRWFAWVCRGPASLSVIPLLAIPMLLTMSSWGVDTPKESLIPHVPATLLYGFCFLIGWMFHRQPELLRGFERYWAWGIGTGLALSLVLVAAGDVVPFRELTREQLRWVRLGHTVLYSGMMWGFVFGFLGLFTRFCRQPSAWIRYVADASYWIYLVHLPLIVCLQILVGRWTMIWPVKYALINAVAIPLLFASYQYLVRYTWIGTQLNGQRIKVNAVLAESGRR